MAVNISFKAMTSKTKSRFPASMLFCFLTFAAALAAIWICDAPDGEVIAELYARCVGVELEKQNGWVHMQIGDPKCAFAGWIREEDLAFGADIENVACGFPDYMPMGGDPEHLYMSSWTELPLYSLESHDTEPVVSKMYYMDPLYLIGRMPDGWYLVLLNDQMLYAIPAELVETIDAEE